MSSFGSQARLAELTAAASARERQAKRDLEEQNKPPKSAPISLSAFTKTTNSSGNRGTKTYRPLTLEDIQEQETQESTSDEISSAEEDHKAATTTQLAPFIEARRTASAVLEAQRSKQLRSQTRVDPPYIADPVPLHPSFHMDAMQQIHSMAIQQQIPSPYQTMPQSAPAGPQSYPFGNYLGPQDISPTKQEEKFREMSQEDGVSEEMHAAMKIQDDSQQYPNYACEPIGHGGGADSFHLQIGGIVLKHQNPPTQNQQYYSQQYPPRDAALAKSHLSNVNVTPSRSASGQADPSALIAPALTHPSQESYETIREIGKSIAEERVRSRVRRGRTVTYNPERHNEESGRTSGNAPFGMIAHEGVSEDSGLFESRQYEMASGFTTPEIPPVPTQESRPRSSTLEGAIRNPAPGLPFPLDIRPPQLPDLDSRDAEWDEHMAALRADQEFMSLQPPNPKDRKRTREVMAKAAKHETIHSADPVMKEVTENRKIRSSETAVWFHSDNRGSEEVRRHLERNIVIQEASRRRQSASMNNNGVLPPNFRIGVDDGLVTNLSLCHVYANLETYLSTDPNKVSTQDRAFYKVKSVPEWATARTGEEKTSYFSSGNKGWIQPPHRIARDPRFRLAPTQPISAAMPMPVTPNRPISRARNLMMPAAGDLGSRVGGLGGIGPMRNASRVPPGVLGLDGQAWQQKVDSLFASRRM